MSENLAGLPPPSLAFSGGNLRSTLLQSPSRADPGYGSRLAGMSLLASERIGHAGENRIMIDTLLALLVTGATLAGGPGATVRTTAGETVHGLVAGYQAGAGLKLVQDDGSARTVPRS